jgi:hypothetical protein
MSKSFNENYFEEDNLKRKKVGKSNKQKRIAIKEYLKRLETEGFDEEDLDELENFDD